MYHYRESGLDGVWLENGFKLSHTPYGEAIAIRDADGLHLAIGRVLARKARLSGPEFRYLRKHLGLSQRTLGAMIGSSEQNVSLWERYGRVPDTAARLVQMIFTDSVDGPVQVRRVLKSLREADGRQHDGLRMARSRRGEWKMAA